VLCRTDNNLFGEMIFVDMLSEIIFEDTIIFCRFFQITLRAGEVGGKLMFNGFWLRPLETRLTVYRLL
jgi:hypothetical protein